MKDKNNSQDLDGFDFSEDDNIFGINDNEWEDFSFPDDDEEDEVTLGPPKPNIPQKRFIEGLSLEGASFENRTFSSFLLSHFSLYNVTFRNCTLDHIDCQNGRFIACKFENCAILTFSGEVYCFRECEFTKCRFRGVQFVDDVFYYSNCKWTNCIDEYED